MAPIDPHSFTDSSHPLINHVSLSLYLDFSTSIIHGSALLTLSSPFSGELSLDIRCLSIDSVFDALTKECLLYDYSTKPADRIRGTELVVVLTGQSSLLIVYSTSPSASALQWLSPPQNFSTKHPFVYTQCQPIHARSIFPCQDTPAARIRYDVAINIPKNLTAVMSARHVRRRLPIPDEAGSMWSSRWCDVNRVVEEFAMDQPIPPYLFAFAVGKLRFRIIGPRTRIYAESAAAEVLDAAALEFAGTEDMIKQGEMLFGKYEWEGFKLLVLPPSCPCGGIGNPRMVFLTSTVIKGDATGAQVVAHALARSWTGSLVTHLTNEHLWLNEGFTTYAERRIVEAVQGEDRAILNMGIGWTGLNGEMERFKDNLEYTKLWNKQKDVHPDNVYSQVPYEKGFQFLLRIQRQIGMTAFDIFLKKYIATFKFKSIDTNTFLSFLKSNIPGIEKKINLELWTEGVGIPEDAYEPTSTIYTKIISLAKEFKKGRMPNEDEVAEWNGQEWELYLENLSKSCEPSQVMALDQRYKLAESKDYDVKVAFLQLAIVTKCREYYGEVEKTLKAVGRMKYLRSLFTALVQTGGIEEKHFADQVFEEAQETYHPIAQGVVESILYKYL